MRTLTKQDCRVLAASIRPAQLGPKGKDIYSRLFQEAFGVPFEMLSMLRAERLTIEQLEKKLRMSRRTIFRYLVAVEKIGCTVDLNEDGYHIKSCGKTVLPMIA
ncbi:MAG: HTH domain-containing protein [Phycisphaerales bacterium]|nr:HTH domain-containing protein [Phycisphaerales bacterium]